MLKPKFFFVSWNVLSFFFFGDGVSNQHNFVRLYLIDNLWFFCKKKLCDSWLANLLYTCCIGNFSVCFCLTKWKEKLKDTCNTRRRHASKFRIFFFWNSKIKVRGEWKYWLQIWKCHILYQGWMLGHKFFPLILIDPSITVYISITKSLWIRYRYNLRNAKFKGAFKSNKNKVKLLWFVNLIHNGFNHIIRKLKIWFMQKCQYHLLQLQIR